MNNQEKFDQLFEEKFESSIDELVENYKEGGLELISEKREDVSDSYDYTDDLLENVYYHKELDLYIKVTGKEESYVGLEWNNYKFVTPRQSTEIVYE